VTTVLSLRAKQWIYPTG